MSNPKAKPSGTLSDRMQGEASWLLSHAQALSDYGRDDDAALEYARAANCAEQAACLLDADGEVLEAAIQRVSAASCCERVGQFTRAVTLYRAALSVELRDKYRADVEQLLRRCLARAKKELSRAARRDARERPSTVP